MPRFPAASGMLPDAIVMGLMAPPFAGPHPAPAAAMLPCQLPPAVCAGEPVGGQRRAIPSSICFEGCGAAVSYHLAAYEAACRAFGRASLQARRVKYVGTSSGSLVALIAALGLDAAYWKERLLQLWAPMGERCLALCQVDYYVGLAIDEILASYSGPGAAHQHLNGRLFVSITHFPMKNVMRSQWTSDGHVKKTILASCFIPFASLRPVQDGKCLAIDGGFSLNNPRLPGDASILVSPTRTPGSDIKPAAKARFRDLIGAPDPARFRALWDTGLADALLYLDPGRLSPTDRHATADRALSPAAAPTQTACGKAYFWAMQQPPCLAGRVALFWACLAVQVAALPVCLVSWLDMCPASDCNQPADPDSSSGLGKSGGGLRGKGPPCCCPPGAVAH